MSIRSDVTIDWSVSPRILTVAAPSAEFSVQDVVDTCRAFEDSSEGMTQPKLIDAAGKDILGGGTFVGVTATLQDARVKFEARGGPSWELMVISGGNLVAVDDVGAELDPREPSAYTSCDRALSSSPTLQEQAAIQFASYGNEVSVDINSSNSGTDYPMGNQQYPVNNLADAVVIANNIGVDRLGVRTSMTLDNETITGFTVAGRSTVTTTLTIDSSLVCDGCTFIDCTLEGTLDGGSIVRECVIGDLAYVNGFVYECGLTGTITLSGASDAVLGNCFQSGTTFPIIDMGGSGQNLSMTNYNGSLTVKNCTAAQVMAIGMNAGNIVLDSTITAGIPIFAGVGVYTDNSTSLTVPVNDVALVSQQSLNASLTTINEGVQKASILVPHTAALP